MFFFFTCFFTSQEGRYFEDTAPKPKEVNGDIKSIRAIPSANIPNDNVESKRLCTKYNLKKKPKILTNISPEKEIKDCFIIFNILSTY